MNTRVDVTPLGVRLPRPFIPHYPHPPQEAFLALPVVVGGVRLGELEALYGGAAGPGKTDALLMAAMQYVDVPGYSAIILRRISPDLHGADGLVERSKQWLIPALSDRAWNGERLSWTFPSGATVRFGHMQYEDDKFKFQGHAYQFIGFDELTHFTRTQYLYMLSRCRQPDEGPLSEVPLRVRAASNPGGRGHDWVKARFITKQTDPEDPEDTPGRARSRTFVAARLADNPSISQESYRRSLAALDPEVRAQLLEGDWDARMPGDWFFDDQYLRAVAEQGARLQSRLAAGDSSLLVDDRVHLGIDTGESWHAVLGLPLEAGGMFVAAEYVGVGQEPTHSTQRTLALNTFGRLWGRARYDAAGVQSMRTFKKESQRLLSGAAPVPSKIPFAKYKGESALYIRRIARRAAGIWQDTAGTEVAERQGGVFLEGPLAGHLAIGPGCPVLLRQLKMLERDPEAPTGTWRKDEDQHGPDALIALLAPVAKRHRALLEGKRPEREAVADL